MSVEEVPEVQKGHVSRISTDTTSDDFALHVGSIVNFLPLDPA